MSCPYLLYNAIIFQTVWRKLPLISVILPAAILFIMFILSTAMTSPSHTNYDEIATSQYCKSWRLNVNYEKSKVVILNKAGRLYVNSNYYINDIKLVCVREYKHLGKICSINGLFSAAVSDLMKRGQKAFFKCCSLFKNASPSVNTIIHTLIIQ